MIEKFADSAMLATLSRHRCVGCGDCCRWKGHVFLYPGEVQRLAAKLELEIADFLRHYCTVVKWRIGTRDQFRIGLVRSADDSGCVFLSGSRCSIHEFKPLMCKAGPAGWGWAANAANFWMYVERSPSFAHPEGTLSMGTANHWFVRTRAVVALAQQVTSISRVAKVYDIPLHVVRSLTVAGFEKEEVPNVSITKPRRADDRNLVKDTQS